MGEVKRKRHWFLIILLIVGLGVGGYFLTNNLIENKVTNDVNDCFVYVTESNSSYTIVHLKNNDNTTKTIRCEDFQIEYYGTRKAGDYMYVNSYTISTTTTTLSPGQEVNLKIIFPVWNSSSNIKYLNKVIY